MACMGPSQERAHELGDKIYEEFLEHLKKKYHFFAALNDPMFPGFKKDREETLTNLKEAIRKASWCEACESF